MLETKTFTITLTSPCPGSVRMGADLPDHIIVTEPGLCAMFWSLLGQGAAEGMLASDDTTRREHIHEYESGGDCGVRVCLDCGGHEGLTRC